jgi:hypothetical protein
MDILMMNLTNVGKKKILAHHAFSYDEAVELINDGML